MSREGPDWPPLTLNPLLPPKYCPQCVRVGLQSRVKKFKVDPASQDLVIMCKNDKCPWPFSVKTLKEVTVQDDQQTKNEIYQNQVTFSVTKQEDLSSLALKKARKDPSSNSPAFAKNGSGSSNNTEEDPIVLSSDSEGYSTDGDDHDDFIGVDPLCGHSPTSTSPLIKKKHDASVTVTLSTDSEEDRNFLVGGVGSKDWPKYLDKDKGCRPTARSVEVGAGLKEDEYADELDRYHRCG